MSKLDRLIEKHQAHLNKDFSTDKKAEKWAEELASLDEKILLEIEKNKESQDAV